MDTFYHVFDSEFDEEEAYQHINPDGREGGIIATSAKVPFGLILGKGSKIGPYATVHKGVSIGLNVYVDFDASIYPEAIIDDGSIIGPRARIGPHNFIGTDVFIAMDAHLGYNVSIGKGTIIGENTSVACRTIINAEDWWITVGPQEPENSIVTAVHSYTYGLRWWFDGNYGNYGISTEEFRTLIDKEYDGDHYGNDHRWLINSVVNHPALVRRVSVTSK